MTPRYKLYVVVGIVAILVFGIVAGTVWSDYRLSKLETAADAAIQRAASSTAAANDAEHRAAQYIAKIEYLEQQLNDIRQFAQKQDEELQKLTIDTHTARSRLDAARRVRSIVATAGELCQKLAEVGRPCRDPVRP